MNRLRHHDGAAAVELGLLLPLLVMLAFGIIEFSTAYNRSQGMNAAVREGARIAATGDHDGNSIKDRVWNALQGDEGGSGFPDVGDLRVEVDGSQDSGYQPCDGSDRVQVAAWVTDSGGIYDLTLVLLPSVSLDFRAEAVFPCLN